MVNRIPGELNTFTPTIWAGYSLDEIDNELNAKGARIITTDIEMRFLYCNGQIYDPLDRKDLKKAIDELGLCPFRSPVKHDLGQALYQVINRLRTGITQIALDTPRDPKYTRVAEARLNTKLWALQQVASTLP